MSRFNFGKNLSECCNKKKLRLFKRLIAHEKTLLLYVLTHLQDATLCLKSGLHLLSRPLLDPQVRLSKNKNYSNKSRSTTSVLYSDKQKKFPGREWAPKKLVGAQDAFSALYV